MNINCYLKKPAKNQTDVRNLLSQKNLDVAADFGRACKRFIRVNQRKLPHLLKEAGHSQGGLNQWLLGLRNHIRYLAERQPAKPTFVHFRSSS